MIQHFIIAVLLLSTVIIRSKYAEKNVTTEGNAAETLDVKVSDMSIVYFAGPFEKKSSKIRLDC